MSVVQKIIPNNWLAGYYIDLRLKRWAIGIVYRTPTRAPVSAPKPELPNGDQELLAKFAHADTRQYAFYQLVQKYQQQLYRIIRRMVLDHDDANDILQEVLIKVYRGLDGFRADAKLSTWMYRIATNETLTFLRRKKTRFMLPIMDVDKLLAGRLENGVLMEADDLQKKLQHAILNLPERQRVVFQLRYFDELPYEDIAQVLNVTEGALKASYHHAMKKIEKYMLEG